MHLLLYFCFLLFLSATLCFTLFIIFYLLLASCVDVRWSVCVRVLLFSPHLSSVPYHHRLKCTGNYHTISELMSLLPGLCPFPSPLLHHTPPTHFFSSLSSRPYLFVVVIFQFFVLSFNYYHSLSSSFLFFFLFLCFSASQSL